MRHTPVVILLLLGTCFVPRALTVAEDTAQPTIDKSQLAEVVNGFAVFLSAEHVRSGEPVLKMRFINAGTEPFDVVELGPMFLEVQGPNRQWRSFQHSDWASDKVDSAITFEVGHVDPVETEQLSRFTILSPGKHRVRVIMVIDSGMVRGYKSQSLWTGTVRSNVIEIAVPEHKNPQD